MKEKYKLLTIKEVCQQLKISRRTLYRLLASGNLPGFKVGHQWRFQFGDVQSYFLALGRNTPTLYHEQVLDKYRQETEKYVLKEDDKCGEIRLIENYQMKDTWAEWFEVIRFSFRCWHGQRVVKLMPEEKFRLVYAEINNWIKNELTRETNKF